MGKVQIIEDSRRCYSRSLAGLVPLLGLPFSIVALLTVRRLKRESGGQWNPAREFVIWGTVLGWLGLLITFVICAVIVLAVANS